MTDTNFVLHRRLRRRDFLTLTAGTAAALLVGAACGDDDEDDRAGTPASDAATRAAAASEKGRALVGDVLDHDLRSDRWRGEFGFVTFKLHAGVVDGQPAYFIRTDASDQRFADTEKLVYVPKMEEAVKAGGRGLSNIYLVSNGVPDQPAVLSSAPHKPDYSPAFRVHRVTLAGNQARLDSEDAVLRAVQAGAARVERTDIVVNYPVVKWPGGELPNDQKREAYLGDGQLLEPVDVAGRKVTFKLHACYPNSRYIVTDVSLAPMATGMKIAPAPGAAPLTEAGATAQILVFGNGPKGSGPMGAQKSVTDTVVGDAGWSPYWDHYTMLWSNESSATVLKSAKEVAEQETAKALRRVPGTPDTNGAVFMVNCPVPVIAEVA